MNRRGSFAVYAAQDDSYRDACASESRSQEISAPLILANAAALAVATLIYVVQSLR